ncbi:unnamed protein product [Moneuplotes crassus]|uniref:CRAL-TRIO domain-containing protein n=1 Tax=Euplotes crassus TaxID=5936 RepID=A0AAD1YDJ0_EUPCR|nr:unnamed protein product [Moneuplotes crassus]
MKKYNPAIVAKKPGEEDISFWALKNGVRIFKSISDLQSSPKWSMKFTITGLSATLSSIMFPCMINARPQTSLEKVYDILSDIEAYPKWLQPITEATEVFRISNGNNFELPSTKEAIVCRGKIDILNSVADNYLPAFLQEKLSTYIKEKVKLPFDFILERNMINGDNQLNHSQSALFLLKILPPKCNTMNRVIPPLKVKIELESFKETDLLFVNIQAELNGSGVDCNTLNQFILNQIIQSFTNLKAYSQLATAEKKKVKVALETKPEIKSEQVKVNIEEEVRIRSSPKRQTVSIRNLQLTKKISQLVCEEDSIIYEEDDVSEKTFDLNSDIGIPPSRPSKIDRKTKDSNRDEKMCTPSTLEEEKKSAQSQETREEFVKKCYRDGEWTKWIPERCTPEELKVYEDFRNRLTTHLGRDVEDNLCLRFLARRDFKDPDYSYKKILEYFEYIEKYDYENLTKEGIIEQAKGKSKKIFDLGVHNFAGFDRQGRPVVLIKVSNVDKGVFNDIGTSRLYLLYQMKMTRARFSPYVDKSITIIDFEGSGLSNLALGMFKTLNPEISNIFPQSTHKNILVHPNWILSMGWKVAKSMLREKQLKKVHFIENKDLPDSLEEDMDIEYIPESLGGEGELQHL